MRKKTSKKLEKLSDEELTQIFNSEIKKATAQLRKKGILKEKDKKRD